MRWSYDTRQDGGTAEFHGDPLVTDDVVIAGSGSRKPGGIGYVYAFERAAGKLRWKYRAGPGVMADIRRVGSTVYGVTLQDELVALDLKTGEVVWKFATGHSNENFLANSPPAASGERVFFGGLDGTVYGLDAYSGQVLWKRELGGRISTSVAPIGDSLYAGSSNRHIYRLDPKTGAVLADLATDQEPGGRLAAAGDSILVFFGEKALACLDASLKRIRWSQTSFGPWTSSRPYLWDGAVLAGNERGEVFALRTSDGSRLWSEKFEGVIRGIATAQGVLYIGTLKGNVYVWRIP